MTTEIIYETLFNGDSAKALLEFPILGHDDYIGLFSSKAADIGLFVHDLGFMVVTYRNANSSTLIEHTNSVNVLKKIVKRESKLDMTMSDITRVEDYLVQNKCVFVD